MTKNWSTQSIRTEISKIKYAESDRNMTGFVTWECKKELYEILWYLEDTLSQCSTYGAVEKEFLLQRDKEVVLNLLQGNK